MSFFNDLSDLIIRPLAPLLGLRLPMREYRDGVAADIEAARLRHRRDVRR